jgi:transposase
VAPLRLIRRVVNEVLVALEAEFAKIYATRGRPSIPPERLLRAVLLQPLYTMSERRGPIHFRNTL